jgi:hypothetical protein
VHFRQRKNAGSVEQDTTYNENLVQFERHNKDRLRCGTLLSVYIMWPSDAETEFKVIRNVPRYAYMYDKLQQRSEGTRFPFLIHSRPRLSLSLSLSLISISHPLGDGENMSYL